MAEKLTVQQLQAVENRGGKLLVSAAAGSGKTKVLVDRSSGRKTPLQDQGKELSDPRQQNSGRKIYRKCEYFLYQREGESVKI